MRFSVIMPSYIKGYRQSASNLDKKLVRAVQSVLNQTYTDYELIIVADGCDDTMNIIKREFAKEGRSGLIRLVQIDKQHKFSGTPRNVGISLATGEYLIYLDADDIYLKNHLNIVNNELNRNENPDWAWYNDLSYNKKTEHFDELQADINIKGRCGTSNICHKRELGVWWSIIGGYAKDDWGIINNLKRRSDNYFKLATPEYGVCHVPFLLDY